MDPANEKQVIAFGEREEQAEAHGTYRRHVDETAASATGDDILVVDAAADDVDESRRDALAQSRLGWTLWRLSDCRTLREELGDKGPLDCP